MLAFFALEKNTKNVSMLKQLERVCDVGQTIDGKNEKEEEEADSALPNLIKIHYL
tara:strand:+ start:634 stop:798 length:165 start_codon:yes stop_codon:yes gene_type:complete